MAGRPAPRRLRYQDVMAMVERLIGEQRLAPGDLLPSRAELAAMAGVSSITVRRALAEL
ncbi:MAG: GntR family transcriptional regulator, partial [Thermoleophilia bacterium]